MDMREEIFSRFSVENKKVELQRERKTAFGRQSNKPKMSEYEFNQALELLNNNEWLYPSFGYIGCSIGENWIGLEIKNNTDDNNSVKNDAMQL